MVLQLITRRILNKLGSDPTVLYYVHTVAISKSYSLVFKNAYHNLDLTYIQCTRTCLILLGETCSYIFVSTCKIMANCSQQVLKPLGSTCRLLLNIGWALIYNLLQIVLVWSSGKLTLHCSWQYCSCAEAVQSRERRKPSERYLEVCRQGLHPYGNHGEAG